MKKLLIIGIIILTNTANAGLFSKDKNKVGCENSIETLHQAIERNILARAYNLGINDQFISTLKNKIATLENDPISRRLSSGTIAQLKAKLEETISDRNNQKVEAQSTLNFIKNQEKVVMQECYNRESAGVEFSLPLFSNPLED